MRGRDADDADLWFACGDALFRRLEPVIRAIADHVRQGIADELNQLAVDLGVRSLGDEVDLLVEVGGEFATTSLAVIRAGVRSAREGRRVEVAEILQTD